MFGYFCRAHDNMNFHDRIHAAKMLIPFVRPGVTSNTIVLGLTRGGIPLAHTLARYFNLPLDVMITRKIGYPFNPEVAMGSIAHDGTIRMQRDFPGFKSPLWSTTDTIMKEQAELQRRNQLYRQGLPPLSAVVRGRNVMLVDDGIATGSTLAASIECLRRFGASKVTVVAPVGSPEAVYDLKTIADAVIVPWTPDDFRAVGNYYDIFPQVEDEEVLFYMFGK